MRVDITDRQPALNSAHTGLVEAINGHRITRYAAATYLTVAS